MHAMQSLQLCAPDAPPILLRCSIHESGCAAVAAAIARCSSLVYINMSSNSLGDAPGALLAEALAGHEGLQRIEFADCGIGNVTSRLASEPI